MMSKLLARRRFIINRTAGFAIVPDRIQPDAMSSSRSWLNNTEPTPRRAAQRPTPDSVHLSEHSTDVGENRPSMSKTRWGSAIMR